MRNPYKKTNYKRTITACLTGYVVQAVVNNLAPLLFLTFQNAYHIPLSQITVLITVNFGVQLSVDLLSVFFVDRIGYRASMLAANACCALGLILMSFLPDVLNSPFSGLLTAVTLYAIGGGLLEVVVSPIVEACPTDNKEKTMSMLHSFYCWGQVGVVLLSTVFFRIFGISNWRILTLIWALLPVLNGLAFIRVPINTLIADGDQGMKLSGLFGCGTFWILMVMMVCAGASELAVSQWASTLAEKGLGVSKAAGDLAGPMFFAALMGLSRAFYGKFGDRVRLDCFMLVSCALCLFSYLLIFFAPHPALGLLGCGLTGLSVGIMWPGTYSRAAASLKRGGTAMFALLALAGDVGCMSGPTIAGFVAGRFGDNLQTGLLAGAVFPFVMLLAILLSAQKRPVGKREHGNP